ncbi:endolytic transglycosylase MltG [Kingella potus]|uniref:endolytic transglycosylase MltG n=1 Tax=Kingella potus TaxID=265175 RepID=UPI001FD4952B|nr:endolytic transglycosylase MltG [Kingella potus]UOP00207.1 endolytic transglycosylase MltG [Kingella potus]
MKKTFYTVFTLFLLAAAAAAFLLFAPKTHSAPYRLKIGGGQGISAAAARLEADGIVYNRHIITAAAYFLGIHNKLHSGNYKLPQRVSAWQILQRLKQGNSDTVSVRIIEGSRFAQMRQIINQTADLQHDTAAWSDEQILKAVDPEATGSPEGLFAPDTYETDAGGSDLQIYRLAYRTMRRNLDQAWSERQSGLPYKTPYEMLILASIIEKETGHPEDRRDVAAVFVNRLNTGMKLQTDPTVIYGMGKAYNDRIRKADLQRDTPYNTYTRPGLTPTPIALPGRAALEAAAHPSAAKYLYFVSQMDGSGKSAFSHTLDEHNTAVRRYILKQK